MRTRSEVPCCHEASFASRSTPWGRKSTRGAPAIALHRLDARARVGKERCMPDQSIEARRAELAALIEGRSDEEITRGVEERGVESVLDGIFQGMAEAFLPDKAAGQSAVVQYDVTVAGAPPPSPLRIGGGRCRGVKGRAGAPRVTLPPAPPTVPRLGAAK